jgi:hypothetical protein
MNFPESASAAFSLKKNYMKFLFAFECCFDRGGIDPDLILAMENLEKNRVRTCRIRRDVQKTEEFSYQVDEIKKNGIPCIDILINSVLTNILIVKVVSNTEVSFRNY